MSDGVRGAVELLGGTSQFCSILATSSMVLRVMSSLARESVAV